ncbi:MAG TPA: signal peptide peptidase SppA, partial [Vampirovibrionales bacterium]
KFVHNNDTSENSKSNIVNKGIVSSLQDSNKILSLELSGVISDGKMNSLLGSNNSNAVFVRDQLIKAIDEDSVKGVLVRINSPGGAVGISYEIYEAVKKVREKKPIIASMGDVAASGGYYVASACEWIYANPGSITGSIGVISHFYNLKGLYDKLGVKDMTIKAGRYKDIGSSGRNMTEEERQIMQSLLDDTYERFVKDVYEGRRAKTDKYGEFRKNLTKDDIRYSAEGLIYTGAQAKAEGLVDELGTYHEALDQLQKAIKKRSKGKIKKDLKVVESLGSKSLSLGDIIKLQSSEGGLLTFLFGKQLQSQEINTSANQQSFNYGLNTMPPVMMLAPEFVSPTFLPSEFILKSK